MIFHCNNNREGLASDTYLNLLLASLPVCLLVWTPGTWVSAGSMIALYHWRVYQRSPCAKLGNLYNLRPYRLLMLAFGGYYYLSIFSLLFLNSPLKSLDNAAIFVFWLALSPLILALRPNRQIFGYGCFVAAAIALGMALVQFHVLHEPRVFGLYGQSLNGSGAIKFADMALLFGLLAFVLLTGPTARHLGAAGFGFGLIVSLYAASRGTLLAAGLCSVVWWFFKTQRLPIGKALMTFVSLVCACVALNYLMHNELLARVQETQMEIAAIFKQELDTPMGIRIQLWLAALNIFAQHPWLGVGLNNFDGAVNALLAQQMLSEAAARYAHAHNEYLCALATGGIIGFAVTLSLFVVPLRLFKRDYYLTLWAKAGFWSICLMSFFALTDCIFDRRMSVIAFISTIAICMAGNLAQQRQK